MNTTLVGKIVSYDPAKQQATVAIQHKQYHFKDDGSREYEAVDYPELTEVPVLQSRGGGFAFTKPIKAGDGVMLQFNGRSMDQYYKTGENKEPDSLRMNSLSDAIAIPGFEPETKALANVDNENFHIRNEAGDAGIKMSPAGKFEMYGQSGEDLVSILHDLLGLLEADQLVINGGSSAGSGHELSNRAGYADLKGKVAGLKLR